MNILVIGDVMIDINYISKIDRNAPEANIPIYNIFDINYKLGGASNVAINLQRLDVNVELISVIGNDYFGSKIKSIILKNKIKNKLFIDKKRKTTQKNRIIYNNSLAVRYDIEDIFDISINLSNKIINFIKEKKNLSAIIISDYEKGMITESLSQNIINYANENNIYTFVDPKTKNYKKYLNCFCFKPNLYESQQISQSKELEKIFEFINNTIKNKNTIITCGENGIYVNNVNSHITHITPISVVDVTGAGDIVITILTYCFLKYKDLFVAAKIANYIAGKSVKVIGNYMVNNKEIENYYQEIMNDCAQQYMYIKNEKKNIIYDTEIDKLISFQDKNVVFTNGCFDIIHSAHLKLLNFARKQGDTLIVGLNGDESIKRNKGEKRPINDINERIEVLLNLNIIDYIIIFNEDTPYNILKHIRPNIMVKGSDYKKENIIGGEFTNHILLFDYIQNKSTSLVVEKILDQNKII